MNQSAHMPKDWPTFDHEMVQLNQGVRRVIKREFATPESLAPLKDAGWTITLAGGRYGHAEDSNVRGDAGDDRTAFIGRRSDVEQALALERIERHGKGQERLEAMRQMGELLGYPACCMEAYLSQRDQSEVSSFERLLEGGSGQLFPMVNNLFVLRHQLISHFPCHLGCTASQTLGEIGLAALGAQSRQARLNLESLLCAPIVVWDRFRFVIKDTPWGTLFAPQLDGVDRVLEHAPLKEFIAQYPSTPALGTALQFAPGNGPSSSRPDGAE